MAQPGQGQGGQGQKKQTGLFYKSPPRYVCITNSSEFGSKLTESLKLFSTDLMDPKTLSGKKSYNDIANAVVKMFLMGNTDGENDAATFTSFSPLKLVNMPSNTNVSIAQYMEDVFKSEINFDAAVNKMNDSIDTYLTGRLLNKNIPDGQLLDKVTVKNEGCYGRIRTAVENIYKFLYTYAAHMNSDTDTALEKIDLSKLPQSFDVNGVKSSQTTEPETDAKNVVPLSNLDDLTNKINEPKYKTELQNALTDFDTVFEACNKSTRWVTNIIDDFRRDSPSLQHKQIVAMMYYKVVKAPDAGPTLTEDQRCDLIKAIIRMITGRMKLNGQLCHQKLANLLSRPDLGPFVRAILMMKKKVNNPDKVINSIYSSYNTLTKMINDLVDPNPSNNFFSKFQSGVYGKGFGCTINGIKCTNKFEAFVVFFRNVEGAQKRCINEVSELERRAGILYAQYELENSQIYNQDVFDSSEADKRNMLPWWETQDVIHYT